MNLLLVGLGGFLGAVARYQLSGIILQNATNWRFPLGTFVVNVLGCLVIGVLGGLVETRGLFTAEVRLFLFTGFLGGFTTFSAFGFETVFLLRRGDWSLAALYVVLSVIVGLAAVWIGLNAFGPTSRGS